MQLFITLKFYWLLWNTVKPFTWFAGVRFKYYFPGIFDKWNNTFVHWPVPLLFKMDQSFYSKKRVKAF